MSSASAPGAVGHACIAIDRVAAVVRRHAPEDDAHAALKVDLLALEAVVAHARHVQDELRFAFEEASRGLTTIELEWRIERSAP